MRFASPNELRVISREYHGFYNAIVVGAIYEFRSSNFDVHSSCSFYGAVKHCIDKHPTLSAIVRDQHTDKAYFERVPTINLEEHIDIVTESDAGPSNAREKANSETTIIESLLPAILDKPWPSDIPPWRATIVPLKSGERGQDHPRCFIAFSFSHALGDGRNGFLWHRTFRDGIFDRVDEAAGTSLTTPRGEFPAPFDTPESLPISWGFLLRPLIAVLLPNFLAEFLGFRPTTSHVDPSTWTGSRMFREPGPFNSCLRLIEIDAAATQKVLQLARGHGAKLTGTMIQSFARGLSKAIPRSEATRLISGMAVNMRRAVPNTSDEMGFFVGACYETHERQDDWASPWTEKTWANARSLTEKLAEAAVTLHDQPVGLLRYVPSITKWTASKIGQERDSSFDVSNLGAFEATLPGISDDHSRCKITDMVFTHSPAVTSAPLTVSAVSVKGSRLMITIAWQPGALGIPRESEAGFVEELGTFVKKDLESLQ
ncbi:hypothetical protein PFICI_03199 [Pestalotiopsis fici W106-1]|uniref:Alcohol acetyltransferase FCK4 n=1 Tax=Pestalotiopsis fici (strain W106-1 / CGMCC3.15140) TaxID=1229662 RepID=W3XGN5_PESFW|nr:uncharacterized protein PFICI_03199 [Pestalotiopsis fici W106-1]ETS85174.1 hypothetical protein PFICI_03199 [Pestalotiopsis fici W106-1]